jgi:hypothetical protein
VKHSRDLGLQQVIVEGNGLKLMYALRKRKKIKVLESIRAID